jgi:hypothetical protein
MPSLHVYGQSSVSRLAGVDILLSENELWPDVNRLMLGVIDEGPGHRKNIILAGLLSWGIRVCTLDTAQDLLALNTGRSIIVPGAGTKVYADQQLTLPVCLLERFFPTSRSLGYEWGAFASRMRPCVFNFGLSILGKKSFCLASIIK